MKPLFAIFMLLFIPEVAIFARDSEPVRMSAEAVYNNAARTEHIEFFRGYIRTGQNFLTASSDRSDDFIESFRQATENCSDSVYRCIKSKAILLVIPRAPLTEAREYTYKGARFSVRTCFHRKKEGCDAVLISATCLYLSKTNSCLEPQIDGDKLNTNIVTVAFIFNADIGVTALGWEEGNELSLAGVERIAKKFILVGGKGLFYPERHN